jgi:hypothetical protein
MKDKVVKVQKIGRSLLIACGYLIDKQQTKEGYMLSMDIGNVIFVVAF